MARDGRNNNRRRRLAQQSESVTVSGFFVELFSAVAALPDTVANLFLGFLRRLKRIAPRFRTVVREHKAGRFPESNRRIVQLFLLIPALVPMWRSLLRERIVQRRQNRLTAGAEHPPHRRAAERRRGRMPLVLAAVAVVLAAVAVFASIYTPATTVTYKGETLEVVRSKAEAQRVAQRVENITNETLGGAFAFAEDTIQYSVGLVQRSELGEVDRLEKELTDEIGLVTYGYSLYINGELIGSTQYEGALEALLEQVKQISVSADTLSVDFVEDVSVRAGYVATDSLVNLGYIAEAINSTKTSEETYTVQQYDTWGKIAMEHGMDNQALLDMNPGYDINSINIGDELVVGREVPTLTVRVKERQNYVTEVNFDISYVDDDNMYQGDTRVIDAGVYGTADVVADVVYVNGVETEREVISQVMLTAPKTEVRARGTQKRPSWMPTGTFRWPASGRLTSGFGYRNTGIRGASTNHMGIDIACSRGSPIYAADGGTVKYTGYKGAMGYTVIIDHGNGFVTYYEHCSSFTCKPGQHVYKGEQIAKVGSSGVASGPHCHFGIQLNGTYVNPMKYLP